MVQLFAKYGKKFLAFLLDKTTRVMVRLTQKVNRYAERGTPPPYPGVRRREWHDGKEIHVGTHID